MENQVQDENSDTDDAEGGRQSLAEFIAEASSSVDMSKLVEDHPWLLEVGKSPAEGVKHTDASSIQPGLLMKLDPNEDDENKQSFCKVAVPKSPDTRTTSSDSSTTKSSSKTKPYQRLPWIFCIIGMLFAVAMFMIVAFYVRHRAYEVINVDKQLILCQNQNFAQVVTEWIVQDLIDTVRRSAQLAAAGSVATTDFTTSQIGGSFPAVMMGIMNSGYCTVRCIYD